MKKMLIVLALVFGLAVPAHATLFSFSGTDAGGVGSAEMEVLISGNVLTVTLVNTSPVQAYVKDGDMKNPGITGFGVNLEDPVPVISSWALTAYSGGSAIAVSDNWDLVYKSEINSFYVDVGAQTENGVKGALYNPGATGGFGGSPQYFTTAVLTVNFMSNPVLESTLEDAAFVRMQNVGVNGDGSLKLIPVPEPSTLLLLGFGLVGLAGARRFKK